MRGACLKFTNQWILLRPRTFTFYQNILLLSRDPVLLKYSRYLANGDFWHSKFRSLFSFKFLLFCIIFVIKFLSFLWNTRGRRRRKPGVLHQRGEYHKILTIFISKGMSLENDMCFIWIIGLLLCKNRLALLHIFTFHGKSFNY